MGLFSDPEVIILKESCDSADYLNKLQELRISVPDNSKAAEKIDREIAITEAGIFGEDSVLFELKNSGMDLAVIRDLYLETSDGRNAQIDFFVVTPYVNVVIECKNLFGEALIQRLHLWQLCFTTCTRIRPAHMMIMFLRGCSCKGNTGRTKTD